MSSYPGKPIIIFSGGPCSGKSRTATIYEVGPGAAVECGGKTYVLQDAGPGQWRAVPASDLELDAERKAAYGRSQFGQAWTRLTRVLAHDAPAQIRRQRAASARIRKAVR